MDLATPAPVGTGEPYPAPRARAVGGRAGRARSSEPSGSPPGPGVAQRPVKTPAIEQRERGFMSFLFVRCFYVMCYSM